MQTIEIIAEAGVNHNGSLELAMQLVDAAASAGADVVKFQSFKAENLVNSQAPMASYQKNNTGIKQTQLDMLKKLELPNSAYAELKKYCQKKNIEFMSSPFDEKSLSYLVEGLGVERLKIASGEITNAPLLLKFGQSGCELILSTGMSTERDIDNALAVLAFGMRYPEKEPSSIADCIEAMRSQEGQSLLLQRVSLLHCTSQYPAPVDDINLSAMASMSARWGLPIGYSDHTEGLTVSLAAAAMGACVLEKHFTLDRNLPGPDHKASLEPDELACLVSAVHDICAAKGDGLKKPQLCESNTRDVARKSVVAASMIKEGELFTADNLMVQRPGVGMSPMKFWDCVGKVAQRAYAVGDLIDD